MQYTHSLICPFKPFLTCSWIIEEGRVHFKYSLTIKSGLYHWCSSSPVHLHPSVSSCSNYSVGWLNSNGTSVWTGQPLIRKRSIASLVISALGPASATKQCIRNRGQWLLCPLLYKCSTKWGIRMSCLCSALSVFLCCKWSLFLS